MGEKEKLQGKVKLGMVGGRRQEETGGDRRR